MFLGKPAGQCKMHCSHKRFIESSVIYDLVPNQEEACADIQIFRVSVKRRREPFQNKGKGYVGFKPKNYSKLNFEVTSYLVMYFKVGWFTEIYRGVLLVEHCKYTLNKTFALIEYIEVYYPAITS